MSCMIKKDTIIEMKIDYGSIYIKLFVKEAPTTCNNFLRYIDEHRYKDFHFYRTVTMSNQPMSNIKIEVIQGGLGFLNVTEQFRDLGNQVASLRKPPTIEYSSRKNFGLPFNQVMMPISLE